MSGTASESFVLLPSEGRKIDLGGFQMCVMADGKSTAGAFTLLEADEPAGFGPPIHIHRDSAEAFYVLDGEYIIFIEEREIACPAGSFVYIPPGVRHGFRVGADASRKLNLYAPAAMIGYFDELSEANKRGDADPEMLSQIAKRYALEIVGPVPEGYL